MNYTQGECDVIVADSFDELNYKQKKLFLASLKQSNPERQKYAAALVKTAGESVYNKLKAKFSDGEYRAKLLANLDKKGVECLTVKSEGYPGQLKQISTPPLVLYMRGNVKLLSERLFGVVGSRKTTAATCAECERICATLSGRLTIVTGVADGADSAAARGALPSGKVICVLPGGHDGNFIGDVKTYREVERAGLTISEFAPGTPARRYTFLLRNRIIAGLTEGVLVVSAAQKSGALNTASYAADYGREVFAFPHSLGIPSGEGCNNLIKSGAFLCSGANDIFAALSLGEAEEEKPELDEDEVAVLGALKDEGELHLEKLCSLLGKKLFEVSAICASLEIKGLVVKTGGNKYAAL